MGPSSQHGRICDLAGKVSGQAGVDDASAISQDSVAAGNATLSFTVDDATKLRYIGITDLPNGQGAANIDFGFRIQNGHADIYENNVFRAAVTVSVDDFLRIDVLGTVVSYTRNGEWQYNSSNAPSYPIYAEAEFLDAGSTLASVKLTGGDSWTMFPGAGFEVSNQASSEPSARDLGIRRLGSRPLCLCARSARQHRGAPRYLHSPGMPLSDAPSDRARSRDPRDD